MFNNCREVCKFDQSWPAQIVDHCAGCGEMIGMFNYPGQRTILCIDDDDGMLCYQKALFERRGYKVLTAASARQGLRIAAVCEVTAVVVDYHMPEMNGLEFATEVKRLKPQMPIVMVSSDDAISEREVVSLGKPVDLVLRLLPTDDESSRTVNMSGVEQTC
jgi:CheY-like chemotaxis protein